MGWVLLRKSTVEDHVRNLPRPRIVQTVLRRGTRKECSELLEQIVHLPEHQSSDQIRVVLEIIIDRKQKDYTSREIHKNEKRHTHHLTRDASESDH